MGGPVLEESFGDALGMGTGPELVMEVHMDVLGTGIAWGLADGPCDGFMEEVECMATEASDDGQGEGVGGGATVPVAEPGNGDVPCRGVGRAGCGDGAEGVEETLMPWAEHGDGVVELDGEHVGRGGAREGHEVVADAGGPRAEVPSAVAEGEVGGGAEDALVGGPDAAMGRVEDDGALAGREESAPRGAGLAPVLGKLTRAGAAVWEDSDEGPPDGAGAVADDKVLDGACGGVRGGDGLGDVGGVFEGAGMGDEGLGPCHGPCDGVEVAGRGGAEDGAPDGVGDAEGTGGGMGDEDGFVMDGEGAPSVGGEVVVWMIGIEAELDEVGGVEHGVGEAPCDVAVGAGDEGGGAGDGDTGEEALVPEVIGPANDGPVPDAGDGDEQVHVVGDEGGTGLGEGAGNRPCVAPGDEGFGAG